MVFAWVVWVSQDSKRLKKILMEALKERKKHLAHLESERRGLARELKSLTESLPPRAGERDNHFGMESVHERTCIRFNRTAAKIRSPRTTYWS